MYENRVLRLICGPKRKKVRGDCRKLHNESFMNCTLTKYSSDDHMKGNG